jgi:hypothetical protein
MPQKIKIVVGSIAVAAELSDTDCAKAIAGKLPVEAVPNERETGSPFFSSEKSVGRNR